MALTRARIVAAPDWLGRAIEAVIRKSLTRARDALALARDVAQMRTRMIKEHPGKSIWDIKHRRGGLVDIEFIAQYLMLRHAAATPGILSPNTADALTRLTNAGYLDRQDAAALQSTLGLWQRLQGVLRLSAEGAFDGDQATEGQRALLIEAGQAIDFERLIADMKAAAATVMENYQRQIAAPAKISPS
jgi:glutamate-ammonia-ligase adenylyltransferase